MPSEDQEIVIAREHARRDRAAHPAEADEAATFAPPSRLSLPPALASGTIAAASSESQGRPSAHDTVGLGRLVAGASSQDALLDGTECEW
jgi:hypothetical protein